MRAAFPEVGPLLPYLASMPGAFVDELLRTIALEDCAELEKERFNWRLWARAEQVPPPGQWRIWGMQAGRGGGKTCAGSHLVVEWLEDNPGVRIGIFGPTAAKVRDVMVEDQDSGLLAVSPPWLGMKYEPSKRRISCANGSRCITYSADSPDQSRGANLHKLWADEVGEWTEPESWSNADMALRKAKDGIQPQAAITTTPRPTELIRSIFQGPKDENDKRSPVKWDMLRPPMGDIPASWIARPAQDTVITRWSTRANSANVAEDFLRRMSEKYAGSRLGRQELEAEILDDVAGALWKLATIDGSRMGLDDCPRRERLVVCVDPSHREGGDGDACGIVVVGLGGPSRHGFVMADCSMSGSPMAWGSRVIKVYDDFRADAVVIEDNESPKRPHQVRDTVAAVDPGGRIRWVTVHSSRDKKTRADAVAALYEAGRVHHVTDPKDPQNLALLEDEMTSWDPSDPNAPSPNRLDALVHGLRYLMLGEQQSAVVSPVVVGSRPSPWRS